MVLNGRGSQTGRKEAEEAGCKHFLLFVNGGRMTRGQERGGEKDDGQALRADPGPVPTCLAVLPRTRAWERARPGFQPVLLTRRATSGQ